MYTLLEGLFPLIPSGKPCFNLKSKIKISSKTEYLRVNQKKYIGSERKRRQGRERKRRTTMSFPFQRQQLFPRKKK